MSSRSMSSPQGKLHADEFDIDEALVRRLIAAQFPKWAGLQCCRGAEAQSMMRRTG